MKSPMMAAATLLLCASVAHAQDKAALAKEGKALIGQFAGALKAELTGAIEAGGAVTAVNVCHTRAPEIAASVSGASEGWVIARSSHKLRNPSNAPDAFTEAAIAEFLARQEAGAAAEDLVTTEIVEEGGDKVFRMVKAIPTGALCLSCHGGAEVAPDVEAALARLYPQDEARGFREGEMRGVFTLRKRLD
jgi:hypothetical protein